MPPRSPLDIRNVALLGHHGAGKTSLAEALLASTGAIARQGSVEKGTTICDVDPEEISRKLSVSLAVAPFVVDGIKVNLIDTPGYPDFAFDVHAGIAICDLAVIVISAVEGVQAQSEDAWRAAQGKARIIVMNKLDRERADFNRTLTQIRTRFGAGIAPVELPIGQETTFRGVIDLLDDKATLYETGTEPPIFGTESPIPNELQTSEHEIHEQLIEGIVVGDDDLMARYLDGDPIGRDELEATLAKGIAEGTVCPVLCASALSGVGIDRLAHLIAELGPQPKTTSVKAGDTVSEVASEPKGDPLVVVAKTFYDQHGGRTSVCRVISGTIRSDQVLTNTRTKHEERLHGIATLKGNDLVGITEVIAGDLFALLRLNNTMTGDTLSPKALPVHVLFPKPPPPQLWVAVKPVSRKDEDKLMSGLAKLGEEDPALMVKRDDETHQTVLGVTGEVHLSVTIEHLKSRFSVNVEREDLAISYRETITKSAEAEGKHKKQSGGHGQFGVCHLRIEPKERGEGFEFIDKVVGGAIPRQFIPAVEKGVREAMDRGGIYGYPVIDVAVTLDDGKFHSVDSSEMSFKMAGIAAFRLAMEQAFPVLLEPITRIKVTVPSELQGDVLGDLSARRGRVQGTDTDTDGNQIITALVPAAELSRYAIDFRSLTGGRGMFECVFDHFNTVPDHLVPEKKRLGTDAEH